MKSREERRKEAAARAKARAERSPEEQLARLDASGHRAARESAKLQRLMDSTAG